ncbi:hypothetical protein [Candidatus Gillettellia adelgis]
MSETTAKVREKTTQVVQIIDALVQRVKMFIPMNMLKTGDIHESARRGVHLIDNS